MSYYKRVIRATGHEFTVEDMVEYGKKEAAKTEMGTDYQNLHRFTVELLEFELGMDAGAKAVLGEAKNLLDVTKTGTAIMASAAIGMRGTAVSKLRELGYIITHPLKKICNRMIQKYDRMTFEGFYYRSARRYLRATGFR